MAYNEPPLKIADGGKTFVQFLDNQVARISCEINLESRTADAYVERYRELKAALTEKYGPPSREREYVDPDYRD